MANPAQKPWCTINLGNYSVKVDKEDLPRIEQHSWRVTVGSTGRIRVVTSIRNGTKVRTLTLGRFLLNPPSNKQVYPRRFQEALDYRKNNLVVCTLAERQRMLPKNRKESSSRYRGVSFSKRDKKWRAAIEVKGLSLNLGVYGSETEAALAYNKAAEKHFGNMAYQNQIKRKTERRR